MKKTLAAVAVLGAFAGSALAADVTLYGVMDTGFQYKHFDSDKQNVDATDSFSMESGQQSGARWGLKGTEDLGNGLTVGFILEDGFAGDTGAEKGVMFDRESSLFLQGSFGKIAAGRLGSINNGTSSWGKYGMLSAFGTSWGDYVAQVGTFAVGAGLWDNMIAYETPSFAGFKVYAQYAMGANDAENESGSDRYYALGATYNNGPLALYAAVDSINYQSWDGKKATDTDDSLTVTLGGNFNFEVATVYAGVQYFDEVKLSSMKGTVNGLDVGEFNSTFTDKVDGKDVVKSGFASKMKGWGLGVSASIPAAGGKVLVGAAYLDAEAADSTTAANQDDELSRWVVSAGYDYALSKRTNVYGVATYMQDSLKFTKTETKNYKDQDPSAIAVMVGLRHKF